MSSSNDSTADGEAQTAASPGASEAQTEEAVLNAAVAFAGHVATAAQQAADQAGDGIAASLRQAMLRQYLLETATLCLRRLGEAYDTAAADPDQSALADLLRDGATRARTVTAEVEALGDLALDLMERLLQ